MNRFVFSLWIATCLVYTGVHGQSAPKQIAEPATAAQAASVLDLTSFPVVTPDTDADAGPTTLLIASQSYPAKGNVVDVAKKALKKYSAAFGVAVSLAIQRPLLVLKFGAMISGFLGSIGLSADVDAVLAKLGLAEIELRITDMAFQRSPLGFAISVCCLFCISFSTDS